MQPLHARRHDLDDLAPSERREAQQRIAGQETAVDSAALDRLCGRINAMFYAKADAHTWLRDQRDVMLTLTWPATWLNERAIGLPLDRYEAILGEIIAGIRDHGDVAKIKHFPTYFTRCVRLWFVHNGEALYEERKRLRNALDLRFLKGMAATPISGPDPIDVLAKAHQMLATAKRPAKARKTSPDDQLDLFG